MGIEIYRAVCEHAVTNPVHTARQTRNVAECGCIFVVGYLPFSTKYKKTNLI